ncbi:MAG: AraC family transcriptional regulator [Bacteroidales bacterium]|nr:AraC family transcriptional regulator [Bacteroidales bacterium]
MFKKYFIIFFLTVFSTAFVANGQNLFSHSSSNDDIIFKYKHLSSRQLLDTANYYFRKNNTETALICYGLLTNAPIKNTTLEHQKIVVEAYNQSAALHYFMSDYRTAYEYLIKALLLCEKTNYTEFEPRIYANIGVIYYRFKKYDLAKQYYLKALSLSSDNSMQRMITLNNLGACELENGRIDSAFYYAQKALQVGEQLSDNNRLHIVWSTIASIHKKSKHYDSAYYYFQLSLAGAEKNNETELKSENLSILGELFFEINKIDSALFYIGLSNVVAKENNFLRIRAKNYLTLSKIEKSRGRHQNALEYFEKHAKLTDSALNTEKFGEVNQLQRLYEVSKTNEQIEQLVLEQHIKERTIHYQRIIQYVILAVLLSVCGVLMFVFFQKRKLDVAYKTLFEKNLKIAEVQEELSKKHPQKHKKSLLTDSAQDILLDKILALMEDTTIICDTEFSIDKLAELVQSNSTYVSQVINNALKKNFRSFLNDYRIKEAQRLFSEPDAAKYTIEAVALQVGFKSRTTFRNVFKEITGISPNFYLKSAQDLHNL